MPASPILAVMVHVQDVACALDWYQRAFPAATRRRTEVDDFEYLFLDGVAVEFVPADEKVGAGAFGSVVYWRVDDFEVALDRMQAVGATLYRGPMAIEDGLRMCQVCDPWGNCIGLRGPSVER